MNSNLTYLASKYFKTSKNWLKSRTCQSVSLSVHYLMQSHNWIDFGHFFHFFCKFLTRHIKEKNEKMYKVFWAPQLKNLKFCQALATTSAFNLELCQAEVLRRNHSKIYYLLKVKVLPWTLLNYMFYNVFILPFFVFWVFFYIDCSFKNIQIKKEKDPWQSQINIIVSK